jgi:hypothetical protein
MDEKGLLPLPLPLFIPLVGFIGCIKKVIELRIVQLRGDMLFCIFQKKGYVREIETKRSDEMECA